jgi:formylglycine-generating enzyme required for sulfatase activity
LGNLKTDQEFTAFCLDEFPEVHSQFSAGMDRTARINLVFQYIDPNIVDHRLSAWLAGQWTRTGRHRNSPYVKRKMLFGGLLVLLLCLFAGLEFYPMQQFFEPSEQMHRPNMILVQPGKFLMIEPSCLVTLTVPFLMSETEVTQGQYQAVMGENPSSFRNKRDWAKRPVESLSWFDAARYCNRLSLKEGFEPCYVFHGDSDVKWPLGLRCTGYRLPTEAEWEYAARAGQDLDFAGSSKPDEVAWYGATLGTGETHPVKRKKPNRWGLYDMSGNVSEWVWDEDGPDSLVEIRKDPVGPMRDGSLRMIRGGSFLQRELGVRIDFRGGVPASDRWQNRGFRLSRSAP